MNSKTVKYTLKDGTTAEKQYTYDTKSYNKSYYEAHKGETHLKKVVCECGQEVCAVALKAHLNTKKHQKKMAAVTPQAVTQ